ncbi:hypothetical protein ABZY14_36865 [Streptomyces sp. NPDC006617]|uniref:alpha/beta hydrolase n=1 Tax=Streptomyces sp. NPDC006617 TaxID=3155354 RepID=UPI0033BB295D
MPARPGTVRPGSVRGGRGFLGAWWGVKSQQGVQVAIECGEGVEGGPGGGVGGGRKGWPDAGSGAGGWGRRPRVRRTVRARAVTSVRRWVSAGSSATWTAGYSQGATVALTLALRYGEPLAGTALYAPFRLPDLPALLPEGRSSSANSRLPVWIGHGARDWIVPEGSGSGLRDLLASWGHPVTRQRYPGGTSPSPAYGPPCRSPHRSAGHPGPRAR